MRATTGNAPVEEIDDVQGRMPRVYRMGTEVSGATLPLPGVDLHGDEVVGHGRRAPFAPDSGTDDSDDVAGHMPRIFGRHTRLAPSSEREDVAGHMSRRFGGYLAGVAIAAVSVPEAAGRHRDDSVGHGRRAIVGPPSEPDDYDDVAGQMPRIYSLRAASDLAVEIEGVDDVEGRMPRILQGFADNDVAPGVAMLDGERDDDAVGANQRTSVPGGHNRSALAGVSAIALAVATLAACAQPADVGASSLTSGASSAAVTVAADPALARPRTDSTVTINGTAFTCETVQGIDDTCTAAAQSVFDTYKQNIQNYVEADDLGVLANPAFELEDVAWVGMAACVNQRQGKTQADFIRFLYTAPGFVFTYRGVHPHHGALDLIAAWKAAARTLCPGDSPQSAVDNTGNLEPLFNVHVPR